MRDVQVQRTLETALEIVEPTPQQPLYNCRQRHRVGASDKQDLGNISFHPEPDTSDDGQGKDHCKSTVNKEKEQPVGKISKAIGRANCLCNTLSLAAGQLGKVHDHAVLHPLERIYGEVKCFESDADKERDYNTGLLVLFPDELHPALPTTTGMRPRSNRLQMEQTAVRVIADGQSAPACDTSRLAPTKRQKCGSRPRGMLSRGSARWGCR
eukprot:7376921-Prymnesium_polylepis.4